MAPEPGPSSPTRQPAATPPARRGYRWLSAGHGAELLVVLGLAAAGVVVALLWRGIAPTIAGWSEADERSIAVDGALVLLGVPAGLLTAAGVLLRPGQRPTLRVLAAILGSVAGSVVAWQVGDLLGDPKLRALSAVAAWPVVTCAFIFIGALVPFSSRRIDRVEAELVARRQRSRPAGPVEPWESMPTAAGADRPGTRPADPDGPSRRSSLDPTA